MPIGRQCSCTNYQRFPLAGNDSNTSQSAKTVLLQIDMLRRSSPATHSCKRKPVIKSHPDAIVYLVSSVREYANAYIAAALAERGVTDILPAHGSVLYALFMRSPMQMSELATLIRRKKNTVTGLISTLERNGYCRREADPKDARAQLIYLTEKTEALVPLMEEVSQRMRDTIWRGFSEQEKEVCAESLGRIIANLKQNLPAPK